MNIRGKIFKAVRWLGFGFLALLSLVVLFLSWLSFEGRREWDKTKKDLLAEGETLSLTGLVPPPVPNDQNFFSDPLWDELTDLVETENNTGKYKIPRRPPGQRQLDGMDRRFTNPEKAAIEAKFPEFTPIDATKSNLELAQTVWNNAKNHNPAERRRAAQFVLAAQAASDPVMARIEQLAQRPEARFPINYEDGVMAGLDHVSYLTKAARLLQRQALAEIELDDPQNAYRLALTILRLANTTAGEPLLISLLVRASIDSLALGVIDEGLKRRIWTDQQLRSFLETLDEIDLRPGLAVALRGERAALNLLFDSLRRSGIAPVNPLVVLSGSESQKLGPGAGLLLAGYMQICGAGDQAGYNRLISDWIASADQTSTSGIKRSLFSDQEILGLKGNLRWSCTHILTATALPGISSAAQRIALIQNQIIQTRLACALESSWLEHGIYPESLEELSPEFLPSIPVDVITLQLMPYRRTEPGKFLLWSVGWNESDEGGVAGKKRAEGDWVWGEPVR